MAHYAPNVPKDLIVKLQRRKNGLYVRIPEPVRRWLSWEEGFVNVRISSRGHLIIEFVDKPPPPPSKGQGRDKSTTHW